MNATTNDNPLNKKKLENQKDINKKKIILQHTTENTSSQLKFANTRLLLLKIPKIKIQINSNIGFPKLPKKKKKKN
jgi:hypothetical protein